MGQGLNEESAGYKEECDIAINSEDIFCIECIIVPKKVLLAVNFTADNGLILHFNSSLEDYEIKAFVNVTPP